MVSSSELSSTRQILMFWSIQWRAWDVTRESENMTAEGKLRELHLCSLRKRGGQGRIFLLS